MAEELLSRNWNSQSKIVAVTLKVDYGHWWAIPSNMMLRCISLSIQRSLLAEKLPFWNWNLQSQMTTCDIENVSQSDVQ